MLLMSCEHVLELIKNILITQTGIPNLTGGQVFMLCIGLLIPLSGHCQRIRAAPAAAHRIRDFSR